MKTLSLLVSAVCLVAVASPAHAEGFHEIYKRVEKKFGDYDEKKPDKTLLGEIKDLLKAAIAAAETEKIKDDEIAEASLNLVYVHYQLKENDECAELAEHILKRYFKTPSARQAGAFAVTAYALDYMDVVNPRSGRTPKLKRDELVKRLRRVGAVILKTWPDEAETDETRMTLGRLESTEENFLAAAELFVNVGKRFREYLDAQSLAGLMYWNEHKRLRKSNPRHKDLADLNAKAEKLLAASSKPLRERDKQLPKLSKALVLNDAMLGELYFLSGRFEDALDHLSPLVDAIREKKVDPEVDEATRLFILFYSLQAMALGEKAENFGKTIELISETTDAATAAEVLDSTIKALKEAIKSEKDREKSKRLQTHVATLQDAIKRLKKVRL